MKRKETERHENKDRKEKRNQRIFMKRYELLTFNNKNMIVNFKFVFQNYAQVFWEKGLEILKQKEKVEIYRVD